MQGGRYKSSDVSVRLLRISQIQPSYTCYLRTKLTSHPIPSHLISSNSLTRSPLFLPSLPCYHSSPFLRDRLNDPSISREHVLVETLSGGGGSGGGGGADAASVLPSARVTVLGSNPVVLIRREV